MHVICPWTPFHSPHRDPRPLVPPPAVRHPSLAPFPAYPISRQSAVFSQSVCPSALSLRPRSAVPWLGLCSAIIRLHTTGSLQSEHISGHRCRLAAVICSLLSVGRQPGRRLLGQRATPTSSLSYPSLLSIYLSVCLSRPVFYTDLAHARTHAPAGKQQQNAEGSAHGPGKARSCSSCHQAASPCFWAVSRGQDPRSRFRRPPITTPAHRFCDGVKLQRKKRVLGVWPRLHHIRRET